MKGEWGCIINTMVDLKKNTVAEWMLKEGYTEVTLMDFIEIYT